ncbi:MAG: thioredoxin family protein [Bacteroidales bacterium]|nr:thioredoxin family protein [Bacteroidales bacterium]
MKIFSTVLLMLILVTFCTSQELNRVVIDPDRGNEDLIGKCDRQGFEHTAFKTWFSDGYQSYNPDENAIKELRNRKKDLKITVVMGTWCSDSRKNIPHFYKILDAVKLDEKNVELIAMDRKKSTGDLDISGLGVTLVPTFILLKRGVEIGRIVENPTLSIEKDMLLILMQGD